MTTDDERREVARRLRETGEELGSAALLWYHIAKILGVRTATDGKTACDMLADLIDPQTSEQTNHDEISLSASLIDREALFRLARYMDKDVAETEAHFSNVISTKSASDYARRIRKALGAES